MKTFFYSLLITLVSLSACSRLSEEEAFSKAKAAVEQKKVDEAVKFYEIIIKEYPGGKLAPDALFYLASIYQNEKKDVPKALEMYQDVVKKYPQSEPAPKALFTSAFIFANQMNNIPKAKELYQQFLDRYPNHEMAKSAKVELDNIGVDPTVLLETLQQKHADNSQTPKTK